MNTKILRGYVETLESITNDIKTKHKGFGAITGKPKYHIEEDISVKRLIGVLARELDYSDKRGGYGEGSSGRLYFAVNGHGLYNEEEIKKELSVLIGTAKQYLQ